jgi:hypothetical protein
LGNSLYSGLVENTGEIIIPDNEDLIIVKITTSKSTYLYKFINKND